MSQDLRSKIIRLAYSNPALRDHLMPLLKTASATWWGFDVGSAYEDDAILDELSDALDGYFKVWCRKNLLLDESNEIRLDYLSDEYNYSPSDQYRIPEAQATIQISVDLKPVKKIQTEILRKHNLPAPNLVNIKELAEFITEDKDWAPKWGPRMRESFDQFIFDNLEYESGGWNSVLNPKRRYVEVTDEIDTYKPWDVSLRGDTLVLTNTTYYHYKWRV